MNRLSAMILAVTVTTISTAPPPAAAGSFNLVAGCNRTDGCFPGVPKSDPSQTVPPFAITHPLGYDREGGSIQIPVCVSSSDPTLIGPTQRALATWNALASAATAADQAPGRGR